MKDGSITIPPSGMPVDGFAGLVELRSPPSWDPYECYGNIISQCKKLEDKYDCKLVLNPSHTFSASELSVIRRSTWAPVKDRTSIISNLYNSKPKLLGRGVAMASLQINISNQIGRAWTTKDGEAIKAQYGMLDIPAVVRKLDEIFAAEIKAAKRAPGWYAVKQDIRLEYRSLPNVCFNSDLPKTLSQL